MTVTDAPIAATASRASNDDLAAAMRVSLADCLAGCPPDPTVLDATQRVRRKYAARPFVRNLRPHLDLLDKTFGATYLRDVDAVALEVIRTEVIARARTTTGSKHGIGAGERFTEAAKHMFAVCAEVTGGRNPTEQMSPLRRPASDRQALTDTAIRQLRDTVSVLRDPQLYGLILVFSLQSGARISGIARLRLKDLREAPFVVLTEKNDTRRQVPITDALRRALLLIAVSRGARGWDDHVFRTLKGARVRRKEVRRQIHKLRHAATAVPGSAVPDGFSHHWLRHTAVNSYVQVAGSVAVGAVFAGHRLNRQYGTTGCYTHVPSTQLIPFAQMLHGDVHDRGDAWLTPLLTDTEGVLSVRGVDDVIASRTPPHGRPVGR